LKPSRTLSISFLTRLVRPQSASSLALATFAGLGTLSLLAALGCKSSAETISDPPRATAAPVASPVATPLAAPIAYPTARRGDVVDDYHGTRVADPYRWLEDPDSPETRHWIEAENEITQKYLASIPERAAIRARLEKLWNYERFGVPFKKAGKYFFTRNDGLQNQSVLYVADSLADKGRVLLDPNLLSKDGTVALGTTQVTEDGRYLGYALSEAGSDWTSLHVREVATGKDLSDRVAWVKFSGIAWTHDASGFFYSTYPAHDTTGKVALKNQTLYFHRLGQPQESDAVVYKRPDEPDWGFHGRVSDDGEMLVVAVSQSTAPKNRVYVKDLRSPSSEIEKIVDVFEAAYDFVGKEGDTLYFRTDDHAPRGRVIAIDAKNPAREKWREVIPESSDTLESAELAAGRWITSYLHDAHNRVQMFELDGRAAESVELPGIGSVAAFSTDAKDPEAFFSFASFTTPTAIYRYDVKEKKLGAWRSPHVDFSPDDYVTREVFYASKDGTRVPMFVSHKKSVHPDASTPALLYGYGGFNISMKPEFRPANLLWMERGGLYAMPCLRGGGEYGREWHEAGIKEKKQNVFDDFIAAAEFLIAQGHTSKEKLAISGRSNGGLLVGACLTQRPDLFGAALPGVGVLDMLRYHRFTIGWAWASDYGTSEEAAGFAYLSRYSPLHNVKAGTSYPPTLITTADHDDRVVPAHSFKFGAALQSAQAGRNPVLIRIETRAGHGAGKPTAMQIDEAADEIAFLTHALNAGSKSAAP
jgi:prolyl oligopeptidase